MRVRLSIQLTLLLTLPLLETVATKRIRRRSPPLFNAEVYGRGLNPAQIGSILASTRSIRP